jgi:hypothetical protein
MEPQANQVSPAPTPGALPDDAGGKSAEPAKRTASPAQVAAARANLARARTVQLARGYVQTPKRLAASLKNLEKARQKPKAGKRAAGPARHWRHGMACASILASLTGAGESLQAFLRHMLDIREAFEPRDAWESHIVAGIGEALWRRFRGLRLAARWHTRNLAGWLAGMTQLGKLESLLGEHEGEKPAPAARRRAMRARRIATGLLARMAEIQTLFRALKRLNRRLLLLAVALTRARTGETVIDAPHAGPVRVAAAGNLDPERIGNPLARRRTENRGERRPGRREEDEPGPAGTGRALHTPEWEAMLVASLEAGAGNQEPLERLACVIWEQLTELTREAREEARQLQTALRNARRLPEAERLASLTMALEETTLGDDGMLMAAEALRKQAEAALDEFLVRTYGEQRGLGWMNRVLARYDRWRWRREGLLDLIEPVGDDEEVDFRLRGIET